ncbi:MAG: hypothetical protein IPJ41_16605 [Phycisphaerales bacterium]|nr:hypothetical protein [Phycisphaerales bacterium]
MQSPDNAFDRVKSLLGKMDRSIDDARHRRLHGPDDEPPPSEIAQTNGDHRPAEAPAAQKVAEEQPEPDARPVSRYGRARPIRELPGNGNLQRA